MKFIATGWWVQDFGAGPIGSYNENVLNVRMSFSMSECMIIVMTSIMKPSTITVKFMGPRSGGQDVCCGQYGHTMYSENVHVYSLRNHVALNRCLQTSKWLKPWDTVREVSDLW